VNPADGSHSQYIHKSHNVSVLLYHLVCPTKYRRAVLEGRADQTLRDICLEIARRYEITFLEIGVDADHAHFLIQSVPVLSPSRLAQIIKSLTAREMLSRLPDLKQSLWGAAFWSSGYFINTVGHHGQGNQSAIRCYIQRQGKEKESEYQVLHEQPLSLFGSDE
jgi:putative transposase